MNDKICFHIVWWQLSALVESVGENSEEAERVQRRIESLHKLALLPSKVIHSDSDSVKVKVKGPLIIHPSIQPSIQEQIFKCMDWELAQVGLTCFKGHPFSLNFRFRVGKVKVKGHPLHKLAKLSASRVIHYPSIYPSIHPEANFLNVWMVYPLMSFE